MIDLLEALTVSLLGGVLPLSISTDPSRIQPTQQKDQLGKTTDAASVSAPVARKAKEFTNDDLSVLVSIVHGSSLGVSRLVDEIKQKITDASKAQIERLIHEHAVKEKRPPATRPLWYVNNDLLLQTQGVRQTAKQGELGDPGNPGDPGDSLPKSNQSQIQLTSGGLQYTAVNNTLEENAAKRQRTDQDAHSD
ncbi:hypothetical protein IWW45_008851 [Coemansia sp. RSA 485]|nr:hypothetical protein IWW45_008851 [Coemansia sp. RSA 485]